jgi:hypothetical protein
MRDSYFALSGCPLTNNMQKKKSFKASSQKFSPAYRFLQAKTNNYQAHGSRWDSYGPRNNCKQVTKKKSA